LDVLFQEFGDDLVLALELVAQRGDHAEVFGTWNRTLALERGGGVLEEELLPGVEDGGLELILVAAIGDGHSIDEVASEDGDLLGGRVVLARLSHGRNFFRVVV
jgi:hypothetical protein